MDESTAMQKNNHSKSIEEHKKATAAFVRASNQIPVVGEGFEQYATFPEFIKFMGAQRSRIIILLRKHLAGAGLKSAKITENRLDDMGHLINANDQLVERIARSLDEHQVSLNTDKLKVNQIALGAEHVPGSSAVTGFKDAAGRYAIFSQMIHESSSITRTTIQKSSSNHQTVETSTDRLICCEKMATVERGKQQAQNQKQQFDLAKYLDNNQQLIQKVLGNNPIEEWEDEAEMLEREEVRNREDEGRRQIYIKSDTSEIDEHMEMGGSRSVISPTMDNKKRASEIMKRLDSNNTSPYACYLAALKQEKKMDIKPEKSELFTIGKRYYSHLENEDEDEEEEEEILEEANVMPNDGVEINLMKKKKRKIVETEEQEVVELQMDDDEERAFFSDPANLTKKAKERMRKKLHKAATIRFQ